MRCHSTTGFDREQVSELVVRICQLRGGRQRQGRPVMLGLFRQVQLTLLLLARQNLN